MNTIRIKASEVQTGDRMAFVAKGGDGIPEGAVVATVLVESPAEWPGRPAIRVTDGLYSLTSPDEMIEIEQRPEFDERRGELGRPYTDPSTESRIQRRRITGPSEMGAPWGLGRPVYEAGVLIGYMPSDWRTGGPDAPAEGPLAPAGGHDLPASAALAWLRQQGRLP